MTYDMERLGREFMHMYQYLYDADVEGREVAGYASAMAYGDQLINEHHPVIKQFAQYREDVLSSDREVAAFGFVFWDMYGWKEQQ